MTYLLKRIGAVGIALTLAFSTLFGISTVQAQDSIDDTLSEVGSATNLTNEDLTTTIGSLINVLLSILGIVLLVLVIYAGFLWMTAGGSEEKVKTAKTIMINAVIGLIILLAAYAISNFVITALSNAGLVS